LFTLVGIAGEDDLDAPDLNVPSSGPAFMPSPPTVSAAATRPHVGNGRANGGPNRRPVPPPTHGPQESARLREGMLAEIQSLSSDTAAAWAKTMLGVKNRLTIEDAQLVESAFEVRLANFPTDLIEPASPESSAPERLSRQDDG